MSRTNTCSECGDLFPLEDNESKITTPRCASCVERLMDGWLELEYILCNGLTYIFTKQDWEAGGQNPIEVRVQTEEEMNLLGSSLY